YTAADGTVVELSDKSVSGGALGGLLQFRRETLDNVQNELGRIAIGMAISFNQQHVQGMDAAGNKALSFTPAGSTGKLSGAVTNVSAFEKAAASYAITFDSANSSFQVNGQPATVKQEAGTNRKTLSFDGIELDVTAYMTQNDATDGAFTVETRQMSFYSVKTPVPIANANNGGAASVSFEYGDIGELTTNDFQVEFKDGNYVMTRMPQGDQVASATPDAQGNAVISF